MSSDFLQILIALISMIFAGLSVLWFLIRPDWFRRSLERPPLPSERLPGILLTTSTGLVVVSLLAILPMTYEKRPLYAFAVLAIFSMALVIFSVTILNRTGRVAKMALLALESTPVPVWIGDRNLRIVYMNKALGDLLGVVREEYVRRRTVEDLIEAAAKITPPAEVGSMRERQFRIGAAFRRGEWHRGEDVLTLEFNERLRPGGRAGTVRIKIIASRIESNGEWLGGVAFFQELP